MREPRIYLSASCSLFFHFLLLFIAALIVNPSVKIDKQQDYIVSIVSDLSRSSPSVEEASQSEVQPQEKATAVPMPKPPPKETTAKRQLSPTNKDTAANDKAVQDRISELSAKKRIEKLVAMRNSIDLSSASNTKGKTTTQGMTSKTGQGKGDYLSMVRAKIMERWIYPESIDKDLEAIVSIRIRKDGTVQLVGLEKSSGNKLFDRSALSAINSIASLPSPPEGIDEIGIRFKP